MQWQVASKDLSVHHAGPPDKLIGLHNAYIMQNCRHVLADKQLSLWWNHTLK